MSTAEPGRRRKALLVIHGIGNQPPLRVLGSFVQGLWRAARPVGVSRSPAAGAAALRDAGPEPVPTVPVSSPEALLIRLAGRARPIVRLPVEDEDIDVIEYHWAEHSVGGMNAAATFLWLLEVVVAGLDFRRQVPFLLAGSTVGKVWPLVLRQLVQVASLAAVAAGLLVAVLVVGARASEAVAAFRLAVAQLPDLPSVREAALLVLFLCLVAAVIVLGRDLVVARFEARRVRNQSATPGAQGSSDVERSSGQSLRSAGPIWSGMYAPAAARWTTPGLTALLLTVIAAVLVGLSVSTALRSYLIVVLTLLAEPAVSVAAFAVAVLAITRSLLLSHVSDVSLYVTSDRLSSRARTRRAILDEGEELLLDLLDSGYEGVYVAGHSLGSVISLDLLDRLARRHAVGQSLPLARLKGLLTFGSPLDKVAYFFRQRPAEGEAVRAQLLNLLHGVRRRPDMRDYGPYMLVKHEPPFEHIDWLQVHAPGDLLSDRLIHYRVNRRVVLAQFNPLTAHNSYWRDDRFYDAALTWLRSEPKV